MRAVVFDLYGTLADIGPIAELAKPYTPLNEQFAADWRHRQLAIAFSMASSKRYENFDVVTERALDDVAPRYYMRLSAEARGKLLGAWREPAFYDDVQTTLATLRYNGIDSAVLTNATMATATNALSKAGVLPMVDAVFSADTVRTYKPHAAVYRLATAYFGCAPDEIVFVSSNTWDESGAAQFGMVSVWCQRPTNPVDPAHYRERAVTALSDVLAIAGVAV